MPCSPPTDGAFDALVPSEIRHLSHVHWTPIAVAIRAAAWLAPATRALDLGCGVGKVCSVGALSSTATWCGVEHHELLVTTARRLARSLGVAARTRFIHGDMFSVDWTEFDALYLYNPFELELRPQIARVEQRLAAMPLGSRVVTLNGFGGTMPASYERVVHERIPATELDLDGWVRR